MAADGAACGSGGLSGSAVGLMLRVVSVSCILSLSFAVLGLGVTSAAVEAMVVMSGDGGVEVTWSLGGAGLSGGLSGSCWAIHRQMQFSLMVWH